jgi:gliding motility-associated-like protein
MAFSLIPLHSLLSGLLLLASTSTHQPAMQLDSSEVLHYCAADFANQQFFEENSDLKAQWELWEEQRYQTLTKSQGAPEMMLYTLPVVVHVIHNNGPENIPDTQVEQAIQWLNDAFANINYYDQGTGVDVQVDFCLAEQDPDGNITTGINHVVSPLTDMNMDTEDLAMKDLIRWDPTRYINIWVVREICANGIGCGVAGYAYFPSAHGSNVDGIVVEAGYTGNTEANTGVLVHEMGHYLGIYHTFQGGCLNNDCALDGDRICDTPPDQSTAPVPCGSPVNSCTTDTDSGFATDQDDLYINYMDYGDLDCYSAFTQGQADRMHFFIENGRSSLLDSPGCDDPCFSAITASFLPGTDQLVNVGTTINFSSSSTNATGYDWQIDGVNFANTANTSYTFDTEGTYEISLTVTNADPNCLDTYTIEVDVRCPVTADFFTSSTEISPGSVAYFTNTSENGTSFEWYLDGVLASTDLQWDNLFDNLGTYDVQLIASNGVCADTSAVAIITVTNDGLSQTGLPIWPGNSSIDGSIHTIDWRETPPFTQTINNTGNGQGPGAITIAGGSTNGAYDGCGNLVFIAAHTGSSDPNSLFLFAPDGSELLTNNTPNGPGLNAVRSGQEMQVVRVPGESSEWYIIYNEWSSDIGAPINNAAYNPNRLNYSRVRYENEAILVLEKDVLLTDGGGVAHTYNDGMAVSRTVEGNPNQHYLYATRRDFFQSSLSVDRWIITNGGITFESNTGEVPVSYWNLTHAGSHLELSPTEDRLAVGSRNQFNNWVDYLIFDTEDFDNITVQTITGNDLILVADGTANDESSVLPFSASIESIAFNNSLPLNYLRNFDRKLSGLEFSPNGRFLYIASGGYGGGGFTNLTYLAQIDLDATPYEVRLQVQEPPDGNYNPVTGLGCPTQNPDCLDAYRSLSHVETGYDGNLYFVKRNDDVLYVIPDPNNVMPQNLVPSSVDLSTPDEPNIQMESMISALPDQIDGFNYLLSNYLEVAIPVAGFNCDGCRDSFDIQINNGSEVLQTFTVFDCPDTLLVCVDTAQVYFLEEPGLGLIYDSAVVNGVVVFPDNVDFFEFSDSTGCVEICSNGIDDDGDGLIDCDDPDIANDCCCLNQLNLDLGPDLIMCDNGIVTLDAGPGFAQYTWNDLTQESTFTAYGPGTYWVVALDSCGLTYTDSVIVSVDPATVMNLGPDILLCAPETEVTLSTTPGFSNYAWFPSTFLSCDDCPSPVVQNPTGPIEYVVVGTNSAGCYSVDTILVTPADTSLALLEVSVCDNQTFSFDGQDLAVGTVTPFVYSGTNGCDSTIVVTVNSAGTSYDLVVDTFACSGSSVVFDGTVIDAGSNEVFTYQTYQGCDSVITVNVAELPVFATTDTIIICAGDSAFIFNDFQSTSGDYSQLYTAVNGCDSVHTITLDVLSPLVVTPNLEPSCLLQNTGSIELAVVGSLPPYSYLWSNGSISEELLDIPGGSYSVTVTDALGCQSILDLPLQSLPEPELSWQLREPTCFGDEDGAIVINPITPNLQFSLSGGAFQADPNLGPIGAGVYDLVIQDENGCTFSASITLGQPDPIFVNLPGDTIISFGNTLLVPAQVAPGADLNYLWTPADVLDCVTCPAVNVTPLVSTLLSVNVTDANGCTAADVMEIRIDPTRPVYVPNAFTPNFDGVNDYFIPYAGNGVRSVVSMLVFDRWGELVFEGSNLQPGDDLSGWDGTFRGKPAASGHYVYLIELEYIDGQTRILKGGIHLIR